MSFLQKPYSYFMLLEFLLARGDEEHTGGGKMRRAIFLIICFLVVVSAANSWAVPTATIHLRKGFNLVALHAETNLGNLFTALGNSSDIEKVMTYDALTQEFVILTPDDLSAEGFAVGGGQGLIVYATTEKDVTFDFAVCPSMEFELGFNLVGIACRGESYSAFQLLNELGSENVSSIQRFAAEKGSFETASFLPDEQLVGIDFPIVPGEGYFLFMRQAASPLDSDGDGLLDSEESQYGTFPDNPDSDGDGLLDGLEVNIYGTNPLEVDTDGDGYDDGLEVAWGSDPLDNGSTPTPPDPAEIAPPVDQTVVTDMADAVAFLYTGSNPVQVGVDPGTIDERRIATLRGKVQDRDGVSLSNVNIKILAHPEYGETWTREDGMFDIVVNGGKPLTIMYTKEGYLAAQRQVEIPLQDFTWAPDVVMMQVDSVVTAVDLTSTEPIQVARSSEITDQDGTRQATLLFSQGTAAEMEMADGSTQPLSDLNVRATEYTVGEGGPKAMPAELPHTSGYTYAVEFTVDEAAAAGAVNVAFSQPVYTYVEDFIGFPVGTPVPAAYYDRQKGQWIPSQNGRVIKILSITGGLADLDTDGDGAVDDATTLQVMGITDAERQTIAALYSAGQQLWRVPVTHFSPWDYNWPYSPPDDAKKPSGGKPKGGDKEEEFFIKCKSIVECQNQVMGETIPVTGTPFTLNYRSDRAPGRTDKFKLDIELTGDSYPASLQRILLEIYVGGKLYTTTEVAPSPNLSYPFEWDGKDAYGRTLQGEQPVRVRIGYSYPAVYQEPAEFEQSFALYSGIPITANWARQEIALWQEWRTTMGVMKAEGFGLGGWSLSVHHMYGPRNHILYRGDGLRRSAETQNLVITTIDATDPNISIPTKVMGPDGSIYMADGIARVIKIAPDGTQTTVAGTGTAGFSGDGGPATQAELDEPYDVAVASDGTLYIADYWNCRVRRVAPDGIISTVAGNGTFGLTGDGGPATEAEIFCPEVIKLGPDGSFYTMADDMGTVIRRIGTDGIITTAAGTGDGFSYNGDGIPATEANIDATDLAIAPDGTLYIADWGNDRVRAVGTDGIISTVAGNGNFGFGGDGGPATRAEMRGPTSIDLGPDGTLYILDEANARVRRVTPDGIIATVAGNGGYGYSGDGGPATQAEIYAQEIAIGPTGEIFIAEDFVDDFPDRIRRIGPQLPGFLVDEIVVASEDGSEVYVFDKSGRHLRTLNALTSSLKYQFGYRYDSSGPLETIEDGDGNITTIEYNGCGAFSGIVSPFGQRTTITLTHSCFGYVTAVANPLGETFQFSYDSGGLLTEITDPKGNSSTFTYDSEGRLTRDQDAAGGFLTLDRVEDPSGYRVSTNTATGQTSSYQVQDLATGEEVRTDTFADGTEVEVIIGTDGERTITTADGTVMTLLQGPDPRFGMNSPIQRAKSIETPGGLVRTVTRERTATLPDPDNPLNISALTNTTAVNGRLFSAVYNAAAKTVTTSTPEGRQLILTLDARGRVVRKQLGNLHPINFTFDQRGRVATITQGTGPDVRTLNITYNSQGYPERMTDPLSRSIDFQYDLAGRVTREILADGRTTAFTYDANGNLASLTPPERSGHTLNYSPVNLVAEYVPPDVGAGTNRTTFTHNLDKQLTLINRPDGRTLTIGYDSAGRLASKALSRGTLTYDYDAATGLLAKITAPDGGTVDFTYDGSLLTSAVWQGTVNGSVGQAYNNDFRIVSRTVNGSNEIDYLYDGDGLLTQAGGLAVTRDALTGLATGTTLAAVSDTRTYNSFGEVASYSADYDTTNIYQVVYTRDAIGRLASKVETIGGVTDTYTYAYDLTGRLTEVRKNNTVIAAYTYDSNNNRLSYTNTTGTTNATYDDQDRLLQHGTTIYTYTANGELLSKTVGTQTTTYSYDELGNLRTVTLPDTTLVGYVIDGANRLIGKKIGDTLVKGYLYKDDLNPVAELDGSNNVISRFVYGVRSNVPEYIIKQGVTYRIIADHLGSPRLVVNVATGEIAQRMDYDTLGKVILDSNPGFQPFGFAGGLYDSDTGLVRLGARDYDPETGRWTAKDPLMFVGGSTNLYVYANDDPVNLVDPDGRQSDEAPAAGTSERNDFENGFQESGVSEARPDDPNIPSNIGDGPVHYYRACEGGTCIEVVWDPETETSGEAMVSIDCEGANCANAEELLERAMEELNEFDPDKITPPEPQPSQPPATATENGGEVTEIPYEGHTNWKICK
jgi:RHS repeat-associated protein